MAAVASAARRLRARRAAGASLVAAAVACAVAAASIAQIEGGAGGDADTAPATIAVAPTTVPPRPASSAAVTSAPPAPAASAATTSVSATPPPADPATTVAPTTLPLSPLNAALGDRVSALPVPPATDVPPVSIRIDGVVDPAPVIPVGVMPDGQLEIPGAAEAGWYELGGAPGQLGATVIAAHVSWQGSLGPFARLADVELGATVDLALADGSARTYQVVERAQFGKLMLPREQIWRTTGPEALVLITCGGAFNPEIRRYADNIVVTAVPVG